LGAGGDSCRIRYQINLELGYGDEITCQVPRKLGKLTFASNEDGIDFSSLKKYITFVREHDAPPMEPLPDTSYVPVDEFARAIKTIAPVYPDSIFGVREIVTVALQVRVGVDGTAREVKVMKKFSPAFDQAATNAVRQWIFEPARLGGKP